MGTNNWRPTPPSGEPTVDSDDWRTTLEPDSRQRIVNEIMETLYRHLTFSSQEALDELRKIAVAYEEKVFTAASSESDYLRRISLKILTMETRCRNKVLPQSVPNNMSSAGVQSFMDTSNWRPTPPSGEPTMDSDDWRTTLEPDSRQRIVNKIMETLYRHLTFSSQEALDELRKIAVAYEEKVFTAASSESDYLRRIALKMLTMETRCRNKVLPQSVPNNMSSAGVQSFMDTSNWSPTPPSGEPTMDSDD